MAPEIEAVFFDVDFTLIYPGPTFQAEGYRRFCASHGVAIDPERFDEAVTASARILDEVDEPAYADRLFIDYTASIIERMGGRGPSVELAAREIYLAWAANHHFEMFDDVEPVLRALGSRGLRVGVISNSHRSLDSFSEHFELHGLIHAAISSAEHGYLKPHPSIFEAALEQVGVPAAAALMVGDSVKADVCGALGAGMRAALLRRSGEVPADLPAGVPVIRRLTEVESLL
jgi:putative hydrolase of the HAD superfamily